MHVTLWGTRGSLGSPGVEGAVFELGSVRINRTRRRGSRTQAMS